MSIFQGEGCILKDEQAVQGDSWDDQDCRDDAIDDKRMKFSSFGCVRCTLLMTSRHHWQMDQDTEL